MSLYRTRSRASADLLARIFYGLPFPVPANGHESRAQKLAVLGLRSRGEIDEDGRLTQHGVRCLIAFLEKPLKRCPHCLHRKRPIEFGASRSWCLDCKAADKRAKKSPLPGK